MNKKFILLPLLFVAPLSLFSCGKSEDPELPKEERIVLNETNVQLVIGQSHQISITLSDVTSSTEVTYSSDNPTVILVSETGLAYANNVGEARVTVTSGRATATVDFVVSYNSNVPVLTIAGVKENTLTVDVNTPYTVDAKINFAGMTFDAENVNYTKLEGSTAEATITGNTLLATKAGDLIYKVDAEFRGASVNPYYLYIDVIDSVYFTLEDSATPNFSYSNINIYTLNSYNGISYKTSFSPVVKVFHNGEEKTSELTIEFKNTAGVVNYDVTNNLVTPVGAGNATLVAKYHEYVKEFPIYVNYVDGGKFDMEDITIDASIGEFPCDQIFADFDSKQILKATSLDGKTEYEVVNGKVLGIKSNNFAEQEIVVYNNQIGFVVKFKAYAKIIRQASDLNCFIIPANTTEKVFQFQDNGYYILANDIDCSGINFPNQTRMLGLGTGQIPANCGFIGTFDGQGHTISNLNAIKGGLFLILGSGSIVKNVAFKNVKLNTSTTNDKFTLATYAYGTTVENVYISSSSEISSVNNALVVANFAQYANVNYCLFEYTGTVTARNNYGSLMHVLDTSTISSKFLANSYVVSAIPMTVTNKNYADTREFSYLSGTPFVQYTAAKHYLDYAEMIAANENFSGFNTRYWDYTTVPGKLVWKA